MNNKTLFKWFSMLLLMMVAGISDAAAQSLGLADFSIKAGETKDVAITLTSESDVYGIQTDILLSEGLSLDGLETIQGLTLSNNEVNGAIRVSLLSLEGASIAAGDVITLKVKAADNFQRGTVGLTNTRITTDTKGTELKVSDLTANVTLESAETNTYSVWLKNEAHWNALYAYAWTTTGEGDAAVTKEFLGTWPGTAMTVDPTATDLWKIEINDTEAPAMIIFNSSVPGEQTGDLVFENGKTYTNLTEDPWVDIVVNGNMEGGSAECFYVTEQFVGGPFIGKITEGIGKDNSRAVMVQSEDEENIGSHKATDWNAQFFIRLPYQIPAGTPYRVSFDYKADKDAPFATQAHAEPGAYKHWGCIGNGNFTTGWNTYTTEGTVDEQMSPNGDFQTIAFNLAGNKQATQFIFDNIKFEIPTSILATLTPSPGNGIAYPDPVVNVNSLAIVGDFLGTENNWDAANGWEMEQDAEKPGTFTLTKEFTAEAKAYEYKATANGNWVDYVLPAGDNAKFVFGTEGYPAGDYVLKFRVNTRLHGMELNVEEAGLQDFTATFTTNADWGSVYAYTWTDATDATDKVEQLGAWPGTKLEKNAETGVYDVIIRAKEAPAMIIFNNGSSEQTENLVFENGKAYEYTIEVGTEAALKEAPEGWTLATTNGNLAEDDASSYSAKEYPEGAIKDATIEAGAGTNGSRGIVVKAGDDTENPDPQAWDSQFFIKLKEALPTGSKIHIEFDYKASQEAKATTQSHGAPGAYQHWAAIGDVYFTTEWQSFSTDITVDDAMAKGDNGNGNGTGLLSIAFNLQEEKSATDYYFDNFGVWYQKPVEIQSMTLVGDFLGLEGDANWDLANGWQMEQSADNPAVWTVKKENFPIEAKTYYYKATANGVWGEYELPEKGNQNYVFNTAGNYDLTFTADTKNHTISLYAVLQQNEGEEAPELVAPNGWTLAVTNGNLAGDDASSYLAKEAPSNEVVPATIVAGAGTNGSRGIIVKSIDRTFNEETQEWDGADWDTQFWILLKEELPSGSKLHVEFDYKASQDALANTQSHGTPGVYQHWAAVGDVNFTPGWQHFSNDITVDDAMAKGDNGNGNGTGLLSIAFNLAVEKTATEYQFDNFGVWYQKPVDIQSMAIVGDFLGLEGDANWDPANGLQMEQSTENPAVWTLKIEKFQAEAKKYEYKATANGKWGDYELPADGNHNFVFGTEDYPAGEYNLTFTADTEMNTLTIDVEKSSIQTFTATFTTNAPWPKVYAYAWTSTLEGGEVTTTEHIGVWPGTELEADENGVYTVTIKSEQAPAMIAFNNGNSGEGNQTEDLVFEDGKAYTYVFTPTFDFENNNGQWTAETSLTAENPITMDEVTLTGISGVKIKTNALNVNKGSFKLTAPEGKSIVRVEFKAMRTSEVFLESSSGDIEQTMVKLNVAEEPVYSIMTWTGDESEVTFTCTARGQNIGFINVVLDDAAPAPMAGDLNGDGFINGYDIVAMVDLIMAQGYKIEADLYPASAPDNVIDGFDLVALVDLIMVQPAPGHSPAISALPEKPLTLTENKAGVKTLGIDAYEQFILTQMMVELADGMTLTGVTTDNRHTVAYRQLDDNKYMVLCYSAENAAFDSNANALTFHYTGNGEMKVNDALLISADKQGYRGTDVTSGSTTGISTIITNGQPFDVYTADGRLVKRGATSIKGLSKGMYIINEQKIVVK